MKILKKFLSLLKTLFILAFLGLTLLTALDIFDFLAVKSERNIIKKKIAGLKAQIHQLKKEKNKLSKQSSVLKNKQFELIEKNKNLIENNINLSNDILLISREINELIDNQKYIIIDTKENILYIKQKGQILYRAKCSVGKGGVLRDKKTGRTWEFGTPRGIFTISKKTKDPVWIKPDWAFVEDNEEIPPIGDPSRRVEGELGKYALDMGFGYKIHGTKKEEFLGRPVSHGCIRLDTEDLEYVYNTIKLKKTKIYIY
ncbi:MAG: L,D-transpeptidase [Elusimicrobia bacterium]|nr:L,D-transpeptidase [Elusimicrobiota bacterium]